MKPCLSCFLPSFLRILFPPPALSLQPLLHSFSIQFALLAWILDERRCQIRTRNNEEYPSGSNLDVFLPPVTPCHIVAVLSISLSLAASLFPLNSFSPSLLRLISSFLPVSDSFLLVGRLPNPTVLVTSSLSCLCCSFVFTCWRKCDASVHPHPTRSRPSSAWFSRTFLLILDYGVVTVFKGCSMCRWQQRASGRYKERSLDSASRLILRRLLGCVLCISPAVLCQGCALPTCLSAHRDSACQRRVTLI